MQALLRAAGFPGSLKGTCGLAMTWAACMSLLFTSVPCSSPCSRYQAGAALGRLEQWSARLLTLPPSAAAKPARGVCHAPTS